MGMMGNHDHGNGGGEDMARKRAEMGFTMFLAEEICFMIMAAMRTTQRTLAL